MRRPRYDACHTGIDSPSCEVNFRPVRTSPSVLGLSKCRPEHFSKCATAVEKTGPRDRRPRRLRAWLLVHHTVGCDRRVSGGWRTAGSRSCMRLAALPALVRDSPGSRPDPPRTARSRATLWCTIRIRFSCNLRMTSRNKDARDVGQRLDTSCRRRRLRLYRVARGLVTSEASNASTRALFDTSAVKRSHV